jgi:hypothetical protein
VYHRFSSTEGATAERETEAAEAEGGELVAAETVEKVWEEEAERSKEQIIGVNTDEALEGLSDRVLQSDLECSDGVEHFEQSLEKRFEAWVSFSSTLVNVMRRAMGRKSEERPPRYCFGSRRLTFP